MNLITNNFSTHCTIFNEVNIEFTAKNLELLVLKVDATQRSCKRAQYWKIAKRTDLRTYLTYACSIRRIRVK